MMWSPIWSPIKIIKAPLLGTSPCRRTRRYSACQPGSSLAQVLQTVQTVQLLVTPSRFVGVGRVLVLGHKLQNKPGVRVTLVLPCSRKPFGRVFFRCKVKNLHKNAQNVQMLMLDARHASDSIYFRYTLELQEPGRNHPWNQMQTKSLAHICTALQLKLRVLKTKCSTRNDAQWLVDPPESTNAISSCRKPSLFTSRGTGAPEPIDFANNLSESICLQLAPNQSPDLQMSIVTCTLSARLPPNLQRKLIFLRNKAAVFQQRDVFVKPDQQGFTMYICLSIETCRWQLGARLSLTK